jgi:hypothetical protein
MHTIVRMIWLMLNIVFGANLATILFFWVACDMHMPLIITNVVSQYFPMLMPLFNVPYLEISYLTASINGKLVFNACLFILFGFIHTFMAQEFVQNQLSQFIFPKQTLRTVYCIIASITAFIIMGFWQHTHVQLWNSLPSTMSIYYQQLVLLSMFSTIYVPGKFMSIRSNH